MPSWPASLPQFVLQDGFSRGMADRAIRSQMDQGPKKARLRYTAAPKPRTFRFIMTTDQLLAFETFYESDLASGILTFTFDDPVDETTVTFAFSSHPEPAVANGPDSFIVTLRLEVRP